MLQKNKRNICYISVPVAPPESISKHRLWWFEVLTLTAKKLTILKSRGFAASETLPQALFFPLLGHFIQI